MTKLLDSFGSIPIGSFMKIKSQDIFVLAVVHKRQDLKAEEILRDWAKTYIKNSWYLNSFIWIFQLMA